MLQLLRQLIHQLNLLVGASVDALVGTRVGAIFDANNVTSVGASFCTCVGKRGDASLRTSFHIYFPISWCIILYISWHITL